MNCNNKKINQPFAPPRVDTDNLGGFRGFYCGPGFKDENNYYFFFTSFLSFLFLGSKGSPSCKTVSLK